MRERGEHGGGKGGALSRRWVSRKPSGAPRGRAAPPAGQICCKSSELDFGRQGAPRPLVSRGRSRELVYRGALAYHVGAERQGNHSPPPLFIESPAASVFKDARSLREVLQSRHTRPDTTPRTPLRMASQAMYAGVRAKGQRATAAHKRTKAVPIYSSNNRERLHLSRLTPKNQVRCKKSAARRRTATTLRLHQATHSKTPPQRS